jgi:excisionase family DNA binding protein
MFKQKSKKKETLTPEVHTQKAHTRLPLVRAETIATYFGVHKRTVALWAERGDIPVVRIGGSMRFDFEEVERKARGEEAHQ